jgi:TubC N-terminal docking domain
MSAALANQLRDMGIMLHLDGNKLRVDSKPGVLTDSIRNLIRTNRLELIVALTPEHTACDLESLPLPSYVKHCDSCGGTHWGPVAGPTVWGCPDCQGKALPLAADDTICPACGERSIVRDGGGRVCFRSTCRFGKSGRRAEPWPNFIEPVSVSLLASMPEKPELLLQGATCPTCAVEIYGRVPCTHLSELRAQALANVLAQMEKRQAKGKIREPLEAAINESGKRVDTLY